MGSTRRQNQLRFGALHTDGDGCISDDLISLCMPIRLLLPTPAHLGALASRAGIRCTTLTSITPLPLYGQLEMNISTSQSQRDA